MSDFFATDLLTFVQLGVRHILDIEAVDHILFLVALAAIYRPRDWRASLWVVSAFTVGHSITLALAVTGVVRFPGRVIEFLIPVTIVATGGLATLFDKHTNVFDAIEPDLTIQGLSLLYDMVASRSP